MTDSKKPPAFFCPECGQKHRTNLDALHSSANAVMHLACVGCAAPLALRLDGDGKPACTREEKPAPPTPKTQAAPVAGKKAPGKQAPIKKPRDGKAPAPTKSKSKSKSKSKGAPTPRKRGKAARKEQAAAKTANIESAAQDAVAEAAAAAAAPDLSSENANAKGPDDATLVGEFGEGDVIGRYTIELVIGQGGSSTVYRAFDPTTNRSVALKVLAKDPSDVMRARFLREIEVQANIRHQNIMPVFDRGELDDGRPFFTMEKLYDPWTLADIIEKRDDGTLSRYPAMKNLADLETLIREVVVPVADGVYVANVENGVIHRDLKPDNVLVDSRTLRPYVIDFGICHVLEKKAGFASKAVVAPTAADEGIVGTPRFLAPEQVTGNVHARTDVWGLGATVFALIAGEPPLAGAQNISKAELKRRVDALKATKKKAVEADDARKIAMCDEQLTRLTDPNLRTLDHLFKDARDGVYSALPAATPAPLKAVVRKAMATSTADRYVNARQLATELQAWLGGTRVRALAEVGGKEAAVESARRAVRRHLVTALWLIGGFVAGMFVAKGTARIGDAPPSTRVAYAESNIQKLSDDLDGLERSAANLTAIERNRLWAMLDGSAAHIEKSIADEPTDDRVDAVRERLAFVRSRFAPVRVRIEAPTGTRMEAKDLVTGGKRPVAIGENTFPPGSYHVFTADGVRFPLELPMVIRDVQAARDLGKEPPLEIVRIPAGDVSVPSGMTLVLGGRVRARDMPFQTASATPSLIATFLMDTAEVTNAEYAQFLATLDKAERKARAPQVGFIPDPEQDGVPIITKGREDAPVVGLRAEDARAYCAWRSKQRGSTVRLPTEAEWVLAAGAALGHDLVNGSTGERTDAEFASPLRPAGAHAKDVSPYAVRGMLGNAREMVDSSMGDLPEGAVLVKGAGVGDDPDRGAIYIHRILAPGERAPNTGFRCVQELK